MMPSKFQVASGTAAGLVGLVVTGLILFVTDPLGTGTTDVAIPAPQAAAASRTAVEADVEPSGEPAAKPSLRPSPITPPS